MYPLGYSNSNWVKCYFFLISMCLSPLQVKQMRHELKYIDNSLFIYPAAYFNYDSNLSFRVKPKNKSLFLQDHNFLSTTENEVYFPAHLSKKRTYNLAGFCLAHLAFWMELKLSSEDIYLLSISKMTSFDYLMMLYGESMPSKCDCL